ncbi:hypothetical protein [Streptomyces torulosus]|uniref:hypothetical protein n=1 Tax=Streptomyces torulosus TaxID=68276 RepID=UPI001F0A6D8A|nr:hypothetical protein [Streptomyces torulosus]
MKTVEAADEAPDGVAVVLGESPAEALADEAEEGATAEVFSRSGALPVAWPEHPVSRLPATSKVTQLPRTTRALPVTQSPQHRSLCPTRRT